MWAMNNGLILVRSHNTIAGIVQLLKVAITFGIAIVRAVYH
jgi:hypothetical protein